MWPPISMEIEKAQCSGIKKHQHTGLKEGRDVPRRRKVTPCSSIYLVVMIFGRAQSKISA